MTGTPTTKGTGGDAGSGELALEPVSKAMKRLGCGRTSFYKLVAEKKVRLAKNVGGIAGSKAVTADVDALIRAALEATTS